MTPAQYWKLQTILERANAQAIQVNQQLTQARHAAMVEAGLDPSKDYDFDDATTTATEKKAANDL